MLSGTCAIDDRDGCGMASFGGLNSKGRNNAKQIQRGIEKRMTGRMEGLVRRLRGRLPRGKSGGQHIDCLLRGLL